MSGVGPPSILHRLLHHLSNILIDFTRASMCVHGPIARVPYAHKDGIDRTLNCQGARAALRVYTRVYIYMCTHPAVAAGADL